MFTHDTVHKRDNSILNFSCSNKCDTYYRNYKAFCSLVRHCQLISLSFLTNLIIRIVNKMGTLIQLFLCNFGLIRYVALLFYYYKKS